MSPWHVSICLTYQIRSGLQFPLTDDGKIAKKFSRRYDPPVTRPGEVVVIMWRTNEI